MLNIENFVNNCDYEIVFRNKITKEEIISKNIERKDVIMFFIMIFLIIVTFSLVIIVLDNKKNKSEIYKSNKNYGYSKKQFMTNNEFYFYKIFKEIAIENNLTIQPQVNLASIINKKDAKYRSELFRNIDFAFFSQDYKELLLLIEINDNTHKQSKRKERDKKVKNICELAKIKLINFYTDKPNEKEYVKNRILKEIKQDYINKIKS